MLKYFTAFYIIKEWKDYSKLLISSYAEIQDNE
jgi:hypothetical protein